MKCKWKIFSVCAAIIIIFVLTEIIVTYNMNRLELKYSNSELLLKNKLADIIGVLNTTIRSEYSCAKIQKEIKETSWINISKDLKIAWQYLGCYKKISHPGELIGQKLKKFEGHAGSLSNHISGMNLVKYIEMAYPGSVEQYSVDLGAAGGSDATALMAMGWKGFQSDGRLDKDIIDQHVNKTNKIVTPPSVPSFLKTFNIPKRIGMMKVDIDSYDWDVLKAFLDAGVSADIYDLEINPVFPPSVHYHFNYSADFVWTFLATRPKEKQILYGASLRAWHDLLAPHGYVLIDLDWYNALFVRSKYVDIFGPMPTDLDTVWRIGWFERDGRHTQKDLVTKHWLNYPRQEAWATMEASEIIKELKEIS